MLLEAFQKLIPNRREQNRRKPKQVWREHANVTQKGQGWKGTFNPLPVTGKCADCCTSMLASIMTYKDAPESCCSTGHRRELESWVS